MNVLSLFGGIECGRIALDAMGIIPTNYFSSEVDSYPMQNAKHNYPDIIHIGSVTDVWYGDGYLGTQDCLHAKIQIDLLIGGSPCQDVSNAGAQKGIASTMVEYLDRKKLGTATRSDLFWEFIRLLGEVKPKYFMLENVRMKSELMEIFNKAIGFEADLIDAALLSPQHRKRLYWCGKRNDDGSYSKVFIPQPDDADIKLKDILEDIPFDALDKMGNPIWKPVPEKYISRIKEREKALCITATYSRACPQDYFDSSMRQLVVGQWRRSNIRIHADQEKICTLTANMGTGGSNVPFIVVPEATKKGFVEVGDMECVDMLQPNSTSRRGRLMANKCHTITLNNKYMVHSQYMWRPLTVRECARCQGIPDTYEFVTFKSRSYKGIGNGWEGRTIRYIFTHLLG